MNQNMVNGLIRTVLACIGGVLGGKGVTDAEAWAQVSGAIIVLVMAVWSLVEKKKITLPPAAPLFIFGMIGLALTSGCATTPNDIEMAKVAGETAKAYYAQPNNADYMVLEGTNVEWIIKGATRITMSGPIPAKSIYPREEGALKTVIEGVQDVTKTAALSMFGVQAVKSVRAQQPTVVMTEKLVPVTGATP